MMVVELLPFFNEIEVLEARCRLTALVVDRVLVAEGTHTHQGDFKPMYLDGVDLPAHVERYTAHFDPAGNGDLPAWTSATRREQLTWKRENFQRDCLANWVKDLAPDDLVLSCDLDEIVVPYAMGRIAQATLNGPVSLGMRMIYYGTREDPRGWQAAKAFRAKDMPRSLSELRLTACPLVPNVGWHLSYLGGLDRRRTKVEAFAHAENRPGTEAWERIEAAMDGPNGETLVDFDPAELPVTLRELVSGPS